MANDYELTKLAARCHTEKWNFDVPHDTPKAELRRKVAQAFDALHKIGDEAVAASKINK